VIHPRGYYFLEEFRLDPFPSFTFVVKGVRIERDRFQVHGQMHCDSVSSAGSGQAFGSFGIAAACRIEGLSQPGLTEPALNRDVQRHHATLSSVRPYGVQSHFYFAHDANELNTQGCWYRNFEYAVERERGLDAV